MWKFQDFNILFRIQHRWHIKCLTEKCIILIGKNKLILNFMASTHLKKVGTRPCLPLCGILPSSFYNSLQTSGDWGDKLLKFRNRNVVHSCLIQASSCSTVLGLLCRIFLFMMRQMFFYGWKIWTAGWPFQYPGSFFYAAMMFVIDAVCGLALSCWKMQGLPWKRRRLDGAYVVLELGYTFQHWWCLSRCVSCHATRIMQPPYHQRCRLLNWALITTWVVLVLFSPDDMASQFSKRTSNFDSSDHRTVFHFATVHFKWALAQRKRLRFWIMFRYGFFFDL